MQHRDEFSNLNPVDEMIDSHGLSDSAPNSQC